MTREVPPQPCVVTGDRDRLMQVLVNLLSNAVKFAPPDAGIVTLRLIADDAVYRVSVADNGPGIPEQDKEHIFDKFRQASGSGEKPVGTG